MDDRADRVIVIVGAARSGTKLLRDLLAAHPAVVSVPYDINFVWRLGANDERDDEISANSITPKKARRVRQQLARFQGQAPVLVEKSVSNCLRIPFVDAILPEAKFIHLVRDGRDVIESARRQWVAPPDWGYLVGKARAFPTLAMRRYGLEYARSLVRRRARMECPPPIWGPHYRGMEGDLAQLGLLETVARQWSICVERALNDLGELPAGRVQTLRYEDLVADPDARVQELWSFAGLDPLDGPELADGVNSTHVGGHRALRDEELQIAMRHLRSPLIRLGYPVPSQPQPGRGTSG